MAVRAAALGEELRARHRRRVVREALLLRPLRHLDDELRAERLLRGRALPREHAHREDHEHRRDHRHRAVQRPALGAQVDERHREQQQDADRRDADRAEDHRLRPLEDPEQVEEEVEVPVGPRNEADRPRVGRLVVELPEPARLRALVVARDRELPDRREHDDHDHDDERHDRVVEHRVREELLPARLDVRLVLLEARAGARRPVR